MMISNILSKLKQIVIFSFVAIVAIGLWLTTMYHIFSMAS